MTAATATATAGPPSCPATTRAAVSHSAAPIPGLQPCAVPMIPLTPAHPNHGPPVNEAHGGRCLLRSPDAGETLRRETPPLLAAFGPLPLHRPPRCRSLARPCRPAGSTGLFWLCVLLRAVDEVKLARNSSLDDDPDDRCPRLVSIPALLRPLLPTKLKPARI
jgi:hypothetical protein